MIHYTDIRGRAASQVAIVAAVAALRAAGLVSGDAGMLGDPVLDDAGEEVARTRQGTAGAWYLALRTSAAAQDVDVTQFGLEPCTAEECAAVLGVWA